MQKTTRTLLTGLIAAAFIAAPAQAQQKLKIGFISTFSGPQGAIGEDMKNSVELALDHLKRKVGGLDTEVIYGDDQVKPDVGTQVADEMLKKHQVNFVSGIIWSNVMLAVAPRVTGAGTFMIGTNAGPNQLAGADCNELLFSTSWQNDQTPEAMGKYMQDAGINDVYIMAPNYAAGKDMLTGFKRYFKGQIVEEVYTQVNQPDYSAELAQLQAAKPDAVFVFYPGGMGVNFIKQMAQAGLMAKLPLYSVFTVDGTTLPALRDAAVGSISGAMWDAALDTPESKKFVADFEAKYKRTPSEYAATAYDAANILNIALGKAKPGDSKALAAAVKAAGSEVKSVRGPFAFNNNNLPVQNYYAFETVKNGSSVTGKLLATPLPKQVDAYHAQCALK